MTKSHVNIAYIWNLWPPFSFAKTWTCAFLFCANLWRHCYSECTLTHACLRFARPLILRYLGTRKHPTQKWCHRDVILTQMAKIKRCFSFENSSRCTVCLICMSALSIHAQSYICASMKLATTDCSSNSRCPTVIVVTLATPIVRGHTLYTCTCM